VGLEPTTLIFARNTLYPTELRPHDLIVTQMPIDRESQTMATEIQKFKRRDQNEKPVGYNPQSTPGQELLQRPRQLLENLSSPVGHGLELAVS
jgi:hypothetical protein